MLSREQDMRRWLAETLGNRNFACVAASDDASFRRYFRIRHDGASLILMDAPPQLENCRAFVDVTARLARAGVRVPAIHAVDLERGFVLLSDLGCAHYLDRLDAASAERLYGDAIAALVRMQARADCHGLPPYDRDRLQAEMELFPEWFLARHLGRPASRAERRLLASCFDFLAACCLEQPQTFVHRDYHSRNLMVLEGEADGPGVIDFQDAVRGPVAYDLVSLLRDVYVRWPAGDVERWLRAYHALAVEAGPLAGHDLDTLRRWFDLTGVQRHIKIAGIFARLHHRDRKPRYLADIPLTLDYLLDVSAHYSELEPLVRLLADIDVQAACRRANARAAQGQPP